MDELGLKDKPMSNLQHPTYQEETNENYEMGQHLNHSKRGNFQAKKHKEEKSALSRIKNR